MSRDPYLRISQDQIVPGIGIYRKAITADATIGPEVNLLEVDTSGGAVTVTLKPMNLWWQGIAISLRDATNTLTIVDEDGFTINGGASYVVTMLYETPYLIPGTTEWVIR